MIYQNPFFIKRDKVLFYDVLKNLNISINKNYKNVSINDIKNLDLAKYNDITFFHSLKYKDSLKFTKSNFILTTSKLSSHLPKKKTKLIVDNVLISVAQLTEYFYPNSLNDQFESCLRNNVKKKKYEKVRFGENVLLGDNIKIICKTQ